MNTYLKVSALCFVLFLLITSLTFSQVSFIEHNITSSFLGAWDLDAKDINGDDYLDIVGAAYNDRVLWWENNGKGIFTEHVVSEILDGPRGIRAADINSDGSMDVIAACYTTNKVKWWSNDGNQKFTEHVIDDNFGGAHTVEAKDMDLDGDMDIICSEFQGQGEIAWWENDGNEIFSKHSISIRFTRCTFIQGEDIDGDSDVDILACGEASGDVIWWQNDGSMNFSEVMIDNNFASAHTVFARDLDLDGDMDILGCAFYSNLFTWWENDGSQNFTRHNIDNLTGALWIDAVDLDNDGDMDLIGAGNPGVDWWENDGSQNFTRHHVEGAFGGGYCVIAADLDGDHDNDLIAAARNANKITWWENDLYRFHFQAEQTTGHAPLTVNFQDLSTCFEDITNRTWDFNNDGTMDSSEKNPNYTYEQSGVYSVALEVATNVDTSKLLYEDYIHVFDGESALLFNGKESYVTCPAFPSLNLTDKLSVEAWIKPSGWGENPMLGFGRIFDKMKIALFLINTSPTFNNHSLALQLSHADGSSSISMTEENSINLDQWQHIAVTYDGTASQLKMFINGIERILSHTKAPSGAIADNNANDLIIGSNVGAGFTFDGLIDEIRIWNTVRTAQEIQANKDKHFMKTTPGLVGGYGMNEGFGEVIADISGNENDGTIINALWRQGLSLVPTSVNKTEDHN